MTRALVALLLAGFSLAVLLLSERPAEGKSKRKNRRAHSHSHSHGHDHDDEGGKGGSSKKSAHGHAHSSPWSFGGGVSVSKSFGDEESEGGAEGGGSESEHGHSHGLLLTDEGHSHAGGAEGGEEEEESGGGTEPTFSLNAGYRLSDAIGLNLGVGFVPSSGVTDPSAGGSYTLQLSRSLKGNVSLSATAPLSQASRDSYKITTVTLGAGPTLTRGRWTFGGKASVGMSSYSKTVVVEEEEETATTLRLQDEGEDVSHEVSDGGTGDREFNRFGLNSTAAYKLTRAVRLGTGFGASYVTHQFGEATIETNMTVIEGSYSWKMLGASLGIITSGADTGFTFPTTPGVTAAVLFIYE